MSASDSKNVDHKDMFFSDGDNSLYLSEIAHIREPLYFLSLLTVSDNEINNLSLSQDGICILVCLKNLGVRIDLDKINFSNFSIRHLFNYLYQKDSVLCDEVLEKIFEKSPPLPMSTNADELKDIFIQIGSSNGIKSAMNFAMYCKNLDYKILKEAFDSHMNINDDVTNEDVICFEMAFSNYKCVRNFFSNKVSEAVLEKCANSSFVKFFREKELKDQTIEEMIDKIKRNISLLDSKSKEAILPAIESFSMIVSEHV